MDGCWLSVTGLPRPFFPISDLKVSTEQPLYHMIIDTKNPWRTLLFTHAADVWTALVADVTSLTFTVTGPMLYLSNECEIILKLTYSVQIWCYLWCRQSEGLVWRPLMTSHNATGLECGSEFCETEGQSTLSKSMYLLLWLKFKVSEGLGGVYGSLHAAQSSTICAAPTAHVPAK